MNTNEAVCKHCGRTVIRGGALVAHEKSCASGGPKKRQRTRYREIFFAYNGVGPYACYFCGDDVSFDSIVVHHIDENETNNSVENLVATHRVCHNGHHFKTLWKEKRDQMLASPTRGHRTKHSEATKNNLSKTMKEKGHKPSEEARELARLVNTGSHRSEETKLKISRAHKARRAAGGEANEDQSND